MTKQSFCEMVEVDGEWVDKFTRQSQLKITDTHIQNLNDGGFEGPVRRKKPKDEDLLAYESRRFRRAEQQQPQIVAVTVAQSKLLPA